MPKQSPEKTRDQRAASIQKKYMTGNDALFRFIFPVTVFSRVPTTQTGLYLRFCHAETGAYYDPLMYEEFPAPGVALQVNWGKALDLSAGMYVINPDLISALFELGTTPEGGYRMRSLGDIDHSKAKALANLMRRFADDLDPEGKKKPGPKADPNVVKGAQYLSQGYHKKQVYTLLKIPIDAHVRRSYSDKWRLYMKRHNMTRPASVKTLPEE